MDEACDADCVIVAVAHNEFRALTLEQLSAMYGNKKPEEKVLIDVKGLYSISDVAEYGLRYWRL